MTMLSCAIFWLAATASTCCAQTQPRSLLTDCLASSGVPQSLPGSTNFTRGVATFNRRIQFTPAALAIPTTPKEVQAAVQCANEHNVTVSAKSGGHSYASWGVGGENGHLVIDMNKLRGISVDNTTFVATVGPGARLGNVALALHAQGQRAISHGTCPGVGAGGLTLHGGYGYSSRLHGLTLDNLVEAEVVLADGSLVRASETQNAGLFWALRGAGSSFGVVTSFKFKTFEAPTLNTVFNYNLRFPTAVNATTALLAVQQFSNTTQPAELQLRLLINTAGVTLMGVYYGSRANFDQAIEPLLLKIGNPTGTNKTVDWIDGLSTYAYASLEQPLENYNAQETFYAKSLMTPALSDGAMSALCEYWFSTAKSIRRSWYLIIDLHGGPSSAISAISNNATAYAHRDSLLKMQFSDSSFGGTYPSDGFSFLDGWVTAIEKASPGAKMGMYANYADPRLTRSEAQRRYWLDNYERLRIVKKAYDPNGRFNNPQGVDSA